MNKSDNIDKRMLSGFYSSDKFKLTNESKKISDLKFDTKPIGYFKDAWMRFKKNKASVTAAIIIFLLFAWAFLTPVLSQYTMKDVDGIYANARPKAAMFARSGFWDGGAKHTVNNSNYIFYCARGIGAENRGDETTTWEQGQSSPFNPIISVSEPYIGSSGKELRDVRLDTYLLPGFMYVTLRNMEQLDKIRAWEEETGHQVIFPMVDVRSRYISQFNINDANFWYRHNDKLEALDADGKQMTVEQVMEQGLTDNYLRDGETGEVMYYRYLDMTNISIRVLYYNYYRYVNDREPMFIFGADAVGYDLMIRMASGTVLSICIALCVSIINLTLGAYLGAIQGYYGGKIDLFLQRLTEMIGNFPFIILYSLIAAHMVNKGTISPFWGLILAFVIAGWIGTSRLVRMQFYRFKNQEYILAARTLGAKDNRLMFKHILPNAIGTIVTSSVLVIPGVIFSESTLSYLGIVSFDSATTTSLGTMLANARGSLATDPHIMFFPSIVISLLMISFNLFGNGLRDAFNPSLRGTE